MKARPPPQARRALVVFGCSLDARGRPSPALARRLEAAFAEAMRDEEALLVLTGGTRTHPQPEGVAMREWLLARGVLASRLVVEDQAHDTLENAERVTPLLARAQVSCVTVMTDDYHAPRARTLLALALSHAGLSAKVDVLCAVSPRHELDATGRALRERLTLVLDRLRQRLRHRRRRPAPVP